MWGRWGGCSREQAPQQSPPRPRGSQSFARDTATPEEGGAVGARNSSLSPGEKGASLPVTLEPHRLDLGGSTYTWIVLNKYSGRFLFYFFRDLQQFEKILRRIFYFGRCFGDARPFEKKLADETLYLLNHVLSLSLL